MRTSWIIRFFLIGLLVTFGLTNMIIDNATSKTIISESPCVDGDGDINLAGIMCEKTTIESQGIYQTEFYFAFYMSCLALGFVFLFFSVMFYQLEELWI